MRSIAFKIGIPRNGGNTSKSLSPVIIQEAFAEKGVPHDENRFDSMGRLHDTSPVREKNEVVAANLKTVQVSDTTMLL